MNTKQDEKKSAKADVCFIILNYNEWKYTQKCISSIDSLDNSGKDLHIVIVDNASANNSVEILKELYHNRDNVHLIVNTRNEGVAAGNNTGFRFIRDNYECDFVITVNSDVTFVQKDFIIRLYKLYDEHPFHVAGPDIYVPDISYHQNPRMLIKDYPSVGQVERMKAKRLSMEKHFQKRDFYAVKRFIVSRYRHACWVRHSYALKQRLNRLIKRAEHIPGMYYPRQMEGVCLHGACLIFDSRYIGARDILFNPLTFLYFEEQILSLDCFLNNWNMIYFPQLVVDHVNGGSTFSQKQNFRDFCKSRKNVLKRTRESADIYLNYLRQKAGLLSKGP